MRVLFVTSEVAGLFKLGGLGDVSYALPVALSKKRVNVSIVLPLYKGIPVGDMKCLGSLAIPFNNSREIVFVFIGRLPQTHIPVYFLANPVFDDYHGPNIEERFALYAVSVSHLYTVLLSREKQRPDIIHCHDWHTSLVPLILGENNKVERQKESLESRSVKTIITIHNILYQGVTDSTLVKKLSLNKTQFHIQQFEKSESINMLREGLEYADTITTVSPTYAKEITTKAFGEGLEDVLHRRRERVVGILNGIDQSQWNPADDVFLPHTYSLINVAMGKQANKKNLQQELTLPVKDIPLFGFVGRLEPRQKGIDILLDTLEVILPTMRFQMVILGTGPKNTTGKIKKLVHKHTGRIAFINAFDEGLAHRIYASCDVLVVPSRFEPCGLIQLIAMRYGTLPLVRDTGGLADTVKDRMIGFVFEKYTAEALTHKMKEAIELVQNNPGKHKRMMSAAMKKKYDWNRSAMQYKKLYEKLLTSSGA